MFEPANYLPYKYIVLLFALTTFLVVYGFYPEYKVNPSSTSSQLILTSPLELEKLPIRNGIITKELPNKEAHDQKVDGEKIDSKETLESKVDMVVKEEAIIENQQPLIVEKPKDILRERKVVVRQGDMLSLLFDRHHLDQTVLHNILSADESLLALETIRPGQTLFFRFDETGLVLNEMELYKHPAYRVIYKRVSKGVFNYKEVIKEGEWRKEQVAGVIESIFYLSAQRAGLAELETANVTRIFQEKLNFSRSIQKGDKFQVIRSVQYIDGEPTGQTRIESARIQRRTHEHNAFLFTDGRYYDEQGRSLARAFIRTPLKKSYRISSPFNPRRVHPVTGRVGPHNGTDFATPTGTRVLSTGDGVVARVGNHPFAGRYIDIKHGGEYKTRYLHLHRVLVRRGESVSRGQVIALSGNTGRSTGPHLHFELHVKGRPVDPMKAKIPIFKVIPKKQRAAFLELVTQQTQMLNGKTLLAKSIGSENRETESL